MEADLIPGGLYGFHPTEPVIEQFGFLKTNRLCNAPYRAVLMLDS